MNFLEHCPTCAWCCGGENLFLSEKEKLLLGEDGFTGKEGARCEKLSEDNTCSIHPKRPLECRLFPLDIILQEGVPTWVLWTGHCPATKVISVESLEKDLLTWEASLEEDWVGSYIAHHAVNQPEKYSQKGFRPLRAFKFRG